MRYDVWLQTAIETWRGFRSFSGRNVLALLGIIIGTAAVIAMLHIGHNARQEAINQFEKLGTDIIGISLYEGEIATNLSDELLETMRHDITGIDKFSIVSNLGGSVRAGREQINLQILAVTEDYFSIAAAYVSEGRLLYSLDGYAPYAVLGKNIAQNLSVSLGKPIMSGDNITVRGQIFTIVGILDEVPVNYVLMTNINDSMLIPFKAARRIGQSTISNIALRFKSGVDDQDISSDIQQWFSQKSPRTNINIQTAKQVIETIDAQMRIYAFLLIGIGSISLLVSGVGIMNVMLISVLERRHEIGIRRAIGATRLDIVFLFLSNSLLLCFIGAFIGLVIGTLAGWIFSVVSGWRYSPSIMAIPLGIFLALVVGLFFGIYPALRAAKMDIVAALRSD